MSDDIVTRLRRAFLVWESHGEVDDLAWSHAADEIERLRMVQSSYALRPKDTLVINVPMNTDPEVCEYLAENVPEHIKGRVVVVRSGC